MSVEDKYYDEALERIEELEAELRIAKSFHDVAVKERDYERTENKRLHLIEQNDYRVLRYAITDVYGDSNGREWTVIHNLRKSLQRGG